MPNGVGAKPTDRIAQEEQGPRAELGEVPACKCRAEGHRPAKESEKKPAERRGKPRECGAPQLRKIRLPEQRGQMVPTVTVGPRSHDNSQEGSISPDNRKSLRPLAEHFPDS